jgi:PKD repeat protein
MRLFSANIQSHWLALACLGWLSLYTAFAQPANDNCANATVISIPNQGFGYGTFSSDTISLIGATREAGENFAAGMPSSKSVWYRFSIPTTREVRILLDQTTNMPVNQVGWRLYRDGSCLPGQAEAVDPPIFNIEGFTHACLREGDYLIQVGAELNANGNIFLSLIVGPSSAPEKAYDYAAWAHDFQVVSSGVNRTVQYEAGCQSYFSGERLCPDSSYTKTTWHVFTTDTLVDLMRMYAREYPFNTSIVTPRNFYFALYEGDVRNDSTGLVVVDTCRSLGQTSQSTYNAAVYACELLPNTTYSLQVLFPTDYFGNVEIGIEEIGSAPTAGPDPANLPASHQLGSLTLGSTYSVSDFFSCNARTRFYPCGNIITDSVYFSNDNTPYDLNWWATFDLSLQTDVRFWLNTSVSQPTVRYRLFRGSAADSCNLSLIGEFSGYGYETIPCLDAGTYSVQVLGQMNINLWPAYRSNLGKNARLNIDLTQQTVNNFGLIGPTDYDPINGLNPLVPGTQYPSTPQSVDCRRTPMPPGDSCGPNYDRVLYRVIDINQDGILVVGGGLWRDLRYKLFDGDASTAPITNNVLSGLNDLSCCQSTYWPFKVCVTPGRYTLVTFADSANIGALDAPWVQFDTFPPTQFTDPLNPEVMDSLSLSNPSISATPTYLNCDLYNPQTILGYAPCGSSEKLIYREFYLSDSASISFTDNTSRYFDPNYLTRYRLFAGRLSTNSLTSLVQDCYRSFSMSSCDFLQAGWYTVVMYAEGDTYQNPAYCGGLGGQVGSRNAFSISINNPYNDPIFNTFAKAEQVNGGNPIDWVQRLTHTDSIPHQDTTYILGTDYFNCDNDLAFPTGITGCNGSENRTSYRVFSLARPSYVYVDIGGYNARIYQGDITSQTAPFSIEHDCFYDNARLCLSPGTYTLVIFAGNNRIGSQVTPSIYLDSLGVSKYDHAAHAYNFGNVPRDSVEYRAAVGAPTDALGRPASNDFIFCGTSARGSDPFYTSCIGGRDTFPYTVPHPTNPRTNLWYTFEVTGPGNLDVSVYSLTPGKTRSVPFAVYQVTNNVYPLTDSTTANLQLVTNNLRSYSCATNQGIRIFRDPCAGITTTRYVVLVDNDQYYQPNRQIQVGIRFSSIPGTAVLYDHYSQANLMTANPTTVCNAPYASQPLGQGVVTGCEGNLTCATQDPTDQNSCGSQTLWYKVEVEGSGRMKVNFTRTDQPSFNATYNANDLLLFREIVPGDSTQAGLQQIPLVGRFDSIPGIGGNYYWGQSCYTTGTYYLMVTGCNTPNATLYPRVWLDNFPGDFCNDSLQVTVDSVGSFQTIGVVDCWTIGESPGENDVNAMDCLGDPIGQKSGWFHITIADTGKMDLDINLSENTTANPLQVRYRVANGRCSGMTFENCVDDGVFITLNLKCRRDSGLWIQVVLPEQATGEVSLNVTATRSTDQSCEPLNPFAPSASFNFQPACEGELVQFVNQSTVGNGLSYQWDFGDGFSSTFKDPSHSYFYPDTFLVQLIVSDTAAADTSQQLVFIYPEPQVSFSAADTVIAGQPMLFTQTSTNTLPGANYYWNFCSGGSFCSASQRTYAGAQPPPITYSVPGTYEVCLTVSNASCERTYCDSVVVEFLDFFGGGPYDGADRDDSISCQQPNFFVGGPYDGFSADDSISCQQPNFFVGGPYDGFDGDDSVSCQQPNFFLGGPYDGFDADDSISCEQPNFFAGGPYDGFDQGKVECQDSMASIFSGGPRDGEGSDDRLLDCEAPSLWAGGPMDGAGDALREVGCPTVNFFTGGPYDGFDDYLHINCPKINFYAGGPYDGFDQIDTSICEPINFFTGGPYDGFDRDDTVDCEQLNFFVGGPYDGFDEADSSYCPELNFFAGGPYDGFDEDRQGVIEVQWDQVCTGDTARLLASDTTNWYDQAVGGTLLAANTNVLILPNLSQTTRVYAENTCGSTERVLGVAHVVDTLVVDFDTAVNCAPMVSYFVSQTLAAGPSLPTIGTEITSLASTGRSPNQRQLSFSSSSYTNFTRLTDGNLSQNAWQASNATAGTAWVQWQYFQPMAVDRITFNSLGSGETTQGRLYYSNGGPWILVKVWGRDDISVQQFDSGPFCETTNRYARRWKLELDVEAGSRPYWSEFQVYANVLTPNASLSWDFGDGSASSTGSSVGHQYLQQGTYAVTLTANSNCACSSQAQKQIRVDTCIVLPLLDHFLAGEYLDEGSIELNWQVDGTFTYAYLEKYHNGHWLELTTFEADSLQLYSFVDESVGYELSNLYRVRVFDGEQFLFSNLVELWPPAPEQSLRLFPNPTRDFVRVAITLPQAAEVRVELLSMLGQVIRKEDPHYFKGEYTFELSTADLAEGQYLVRTWIDGLPTVRKLVVIR